jgi:tetratricopeptide (TPR) repeat protein
MLTRISLKNNQLKSALSYANKAIKTYQQTNHAVGIFENLYLKAEILYQKEDYKQSKEILTALIKQKNPHSTTYYPANAYTLLGLINLAENNINLATTLFKQALDLEHSQDRLKGAIVDYNNLAEISKLKGDKDEEYKYLNLALNYAKDIKDQELINYLEKKLS